MQVPDTDMQVPDTDMGTVSEGGGGEGDIMVDVTLCLEGETPVKSAPICWPSNDISRHLCDIRILSNAFKPFHPEL